MLELSIEAGKGSGVWRGLSCRVVCRICSVVCLGWVGVMFRMNEVGGYVGCIGRYYKIGWGICRVRWSICRVCCGMCRVG